MILFTCIIFFLMLIFIFAKNTLVVNAKNLQVDITAKNGKKLKLNEKNFYVDGALEADEADNFKFKSIHSAIEKAVDGTEIEPMVIYIEPDVYQMKGTSHDRGLYIDKQWVSFIGLTFDAKEVVIADNRGHMIGAVSSSGSSPAETIFIKGTGFHAENLTIGNYCNVDLVYAKDTTKNQSKRSETITQAYCIGAKAENGILDKFYFKNVHFISMLDTLALGEVKRAYFEECYIQGTDDYMGCSEGVHVMKNTVLHCYSTKPIYYAGKNGMAFINCKWEIDFDEAEALTIAKNSSTVYLIDCEFEDLNGKLKAIKWSPNCESNIKCYSHNIKLDGKNYSILPGENGHELTREQAKAYFTYNFLKGSDDWDPSREKATCAEYGDLPINILITKAETIMTNESEAKLEASIYPYSPNQNIVWTINSEYGSLSSQKGSIVKVKGNNTKEYPVLVTVNATADNGISNQCILTIYPALLEAPKFLEVPQISEPLNGELCISYVLNLSFTGGNRKDESIITWYRSRNIEGKEALEVAVSRFNKPLLKYKLTSGDIGHYIIAVIEPKHSRSGVGKKITIISKRVIDIKDIKGEGKGKYNYFTNFENFPVSFQPVLENGTWSIDSYYPLDQYVNWIPAKGNSFEYASGIAGAAEGYGLLTVGQGVRLLYTQDGDFGDMRVNLKVNPEKTAAQGFGSANGQYLEIYIKYNTRTKTGYGLRIERTVKYGFATDFTLYEYVNGRGKSISNSVSTTAFNPGCNIDLWVEKNTLYAEATTKSQQSINQINAALPNSVYISAEISGNTYGGVGIQHTGTVGSGGRIQLKALSVSYSNTK